MKKISIGFTTSLLMALLPIVISGQTKTEEQDYYNWFDEITGIESSELHYGIVYLEKHRVKGKKTKFFPEPDFVSGSVVFNGRPYFSVDLKYNVYDDELLMRVDKRFGGNTLQLYKNRVDSFIIGGHSFIKIHDSKIASGFYEVSLKKRLFYLLKKHHKTLRRLLGQKSVFYEFENGDKEFFLLYKDVYHPIKETSDLTELFPEYRTHLQSFDEMENRDLEFEERLEKLLNYLDTLLPEEINKTIER